MAGTSRKHGLFAALEQRFGRTGRALRQITRLGRDAQFVGAPSIENRGVLEIGDHFRMESRPVAAHLVVHRGGELHIGQRVTLGHGSGIACHSRIEIGDDSSIGAFSMLLDSDYHVAGDHGNHGEPLPIRIGRGVVIGNHVSILRGSVLGDGVVVESGSVVSGEIPAHERVSGVPARSVVERTAEVRSLEGMSTEARVVEVARRCFRLSETPAITDGPAQITRWDSLGALSFLLALEDEFTVTLTQDQTAGVASLADVVPIIERARRSSVAA